MWSGERLPQSLRCVCGLLCGFGAGCSLALLRVAARCGAARSFGRRETLGKFEVNSPGTCIQDPSLNFRCFSDPLWEGRHGV